MNKKAALDWKTVGAVMLGSIGALSAGKFIDELMGYIKEQRLKGKSREYFEQMLEAHPLLKKQDPKIVAQYWASLFHFAPHMAADPLASGAFIRQALDRGYPELYGGPPIDTYGTLTSVNKSVTDSRQGSTSYTDAAGAAVGKLMGAGLLDVTGMSHNTGGNTDRYGALPMD